MSLRQRRRRTADGGTTHDCIPMQLVSSGTHLPHAPRPMKFKAAALSRSRYLKVLLRY